MDQKAALTLLVEAVNVAQKRGVYSLQEAGVISQAVSVFTTSSNVDPKTEEETDDNTDTED